MFFWRKKKKDGPRAEHRRHYRRAPGKKHALAVKALVADQSFKGEIVDLSAGGAGIQFPTDKAPEVDSGGEVRLSFTSLVHGGEVSALARVASVREEEEGSTIRRFGFEFSDHEALFAQLDTYYFKFFNRRRAMRVRPALDKKLTATLNFGPGNMEVSIFDISPDGFGMVMAPEKASLLDEVEDLGCTFTLPGAPEPQAWQARAVHISELQHGVHFGAVFLLNPEDEEAAVQRQQMVNFCAERAAEIALWDTNSS